MLYGRLIQMSNNYIFGTTSWESSRNVYFNPFLKHSDSWAGLFMHTSNRRSCHDNPEHDLSKSYNFILC